MDIFKSLTQKLIYQIKMGTEEGDGYGRSRYILMCEPLIL